MTDQLFLSPNLVPILHQANQLRLTKELQVYQSSAQLSAPESWPTGTRTVTGHKRRLQEINGDISSSIKQITNSSEKGNQLCAAAAEADLPRRSYCVEFSRRRDGRDSRRQRSDDRIRSEITLHHFCQSPAVPSDFYSDLPALPSGISESLSSEYTYIYH